MRHVLTACVTCVPRLALKLAAPSACDRPHGKALRSPRGRESQLSRQWAQPSRPPTCRFLATLASITFRTAGWSDSPTESASRVYTLLLCMTCTCPSVSGVLHEHAFHTCVRVRVRAHIRT